MLHLDDPALLEGPGASRYRQAFERGYRGLRFDRPLEREFRRFRDGIGRARVRWAALLALVLFGLFVFIDFATLPAHVARRTAGIRIGLVMPMCLLVIAVVHSVPWRAYLQRTLMLASTAIGLGTVAIIAVALHAGAHLPYEGILLVALYIYLVAGLDWRLAVFANLVTLVAFAAVQSLLQPDPEARMFQLVYLGTANAVGAYGGYVLERGMRTTFLMQGMLNDLAERDGLTGLYNRRALNNHLERAWRQALREGAEVALALVDVDHFKQYNDRYGHAHGDAALRAVAARIGAQARRPMDFAARYGG
ncbi:MAG TPA: GGDEF domain-containing protein, partial [Lysobacter sp.]